MGFNSGFKGLKTRNVVVCLHKSSYGECKLVLVSTGINPGRYLQNFTQNWNCTLSAFTKTESKHWTPPKDVTQCV